MEPEEAFIASPKTERLISIPADIPDQINDRLVRFNSSRPSRRITS